MTEGGKVVGCVCEAEEGYVRYNASKGVVLAAGDIGGNLDMCKAYAPICVAHGFPRSQHRGRHRSGHKMGMWADAQLQDLPLLMMHPQAFCWFHGPFLFVNDEGRRFMCEDTWVQGKSLAINRQPNGEAWSVFDANWRPTWSTACPTAAGCSGTASAPAGGDVGSREVLPDADPQVHRAGHRVQGGHARGAGGRHRYDPDTLAATVDRYNSMCDARGTDYYKKPVFLTPVRQGPFYALKVGPALLTVPAG